MNRDYFSRKTEPKLSWPYIILCLLGALLLFGIPHAYNCVKAKRLNEVYGTHFTAWDIWMGVEKNYREVSQ